MKRKVLIALIIAVAAVSCKKEDSVKPEVKTVTVDYNGDKFKERTEMKPVYIKP